MATKAWIALVDWADGNVEDTDEMRVKANTPGQAIAAARAAWTATNGAKWPHCRINRISVMSPARLRRLSDTQGCGTLLEGVCHHDTAPSSR